MAKQRACREVEPRGSSGAKAEPGRRARSGCRRREGGGAQLRALSSPRTWPITFGPWIGGNLFVFDHRLRPHQEMIKYIIHAEIPYLKFEDPYLQPWINTMQPTFIVKDRQTITMIASRNLRT